MMVQLIINIAYSVTCSYFLLDKVFDTKFKKVLIVRQTLHLIRRKNNPRDQLLKYSHCG